MEKRSSYLIGTQQDQHNGAGILIVFKAVLRFIVAAGVIITEFEIFEQMASQDWPYMFTPLFAVAIAATAAFWAIERIGK